MRKSTVLLGTVLVAAMHIGSGELLWAAKKSRYPSVHLIDANHPSQHLRVRLYDRRGRPRRNAQRLVSKFMRCRRTGRWRTMSWRLLARLHRVSRHFKGAAIHVYSGYRHRSVAWHKRSYHIRGMAVDLRVAGISKRRLRDFLLKRYPRAGIGYYPNSPFIHFDVRRRHAFWIDYSGSGEPPRYAKNARSILKMDRLASRHVAENTRQAPMIVSGLVPLGPPAIVE